jgi:hypothetical protein
MGPFVNKKWWKLLVRIGKALLVAVACLAIFAFMPQPLFYHLKAEYSQMPADDHQLEAWLKLQPGVERIWLIRREGHAIRVWFAIAQNLYGRPVTPDLSGACDSFGYVPHQEWRNDPSNTASWDPKEDNVPKENKSND